VINTLSLIFSWVSYIVGTILRKVSLSSKVSVTRLGKILPFGQTFLALGDFFKEKIAQWFGRNFSWIKLVGGLFGPFLRSFGDLITKTVPRQDVTRQNVALQNVARQNVARQNVAQQDVAFIIYTKTSREKMSPYP
jgi:hypothetical protein